MSPDGREPLLAGPDLRFFLDALSRFEPPDNVSRVFQERIFRLVETRSETAFERTAYDPGHITGSAFIVDPAGRTVLLHLHKRLGKWLQMGGHADGELDPAATALREGAEESGLLDLRLLSPEILDLDIHEIPARGKEPGHEHFDVRYALVTRQPAGIARQEQESESLAWFGFDEALEKMGEPGAARALSRLESWLQLSKSLR